jgi:Domain of unknown function (DUF4159)
MKAGSLIRLYRRRCIGMILAVLVSLPAFAQGGRRGGAGGGGRASYMDDLSNQEMDWPVNAGFKEDVFTFARLKHQTGGGFGFGRRASWAEDYPLADVMLSFRVHQITSMNVRSGPNPIDITKEDLAKFPFVYLSGVETLSFQEQEMVALREYLLNGGFMMVDNFWGDAAWKNFQAEMRRLFPGREAVDLGIDHPIFHAVYNFKTKPQMPTAGVYQSFGVFYDPNRDYDVMSHDPHYFAMYDDKGRIMMIICHNNHFGDGWEHEGDDPNYFHVISEGMAYPMFINILVYAMSH